MTDYPSPPEFLPGLANFADQNLTNAAALSRLGMAFNQLVQRYNQMLQWVSWMLNVDVTHPQLDVWPGSRNLTTAGDLDVLSFVDPGAATFGPPTLESGQTYYVSICQMRLGETQGAADFLASNTTLDVKAKGDIHFQGGPSSFDKVIIRNVVDAGVSVQITAAAGDLEILGNNQKIIMGADQDAYLDRATAGFVIASSPSMIIGELAESGLVTKVTVQNGETPLVMFASTAGDVEILGQGQHLTFGPGQDAKLCYDGEFFLVEATMTRVPGGAWFGPDTLEVGAGYSIRSAFAYLGTNNPDGSFVSDPGAPMRVIGNGGVALQDTDGEYDVDLLRWNPAGDDPACWVFSEGAGAVHLRGDNVWITVGAYDDGGIAWDGTNLLIGSSTGKTVCDGPLEAQGYWSSSGNEEGSHEGMTVVTGGMTFENGLAVSGTITTNIDDVPQNGIAYARSWLLADEAPTWVEVPDTFTDVSTDALYARSQDTEGHGIWVEIPDITLPPNDEEFYVQHEGDWWALTTDDLVTLGAQDLIDDTLTDWPGSENIVTVGEIETGTWTAGYVTTDLLTATAAIVPIIHAHTDSTAAVAVTNAAGSVAVVVVDTTNHRVSIGTNAAPTSTLDVGGTVTALGLELGVHSITMGSSDGVDLHGTGSSLIISTGSGSGDHVGITTPVLAVTGKISATGGWTGDIHTDGDLFLSSTHAIVFGPSANALLQWDGNNLKATAPMLWVQGDETVTGNLGVGNLLLVKDLSLVSGNYSHVLNTSDNNLNLITGGTKIVTNSGMDVAGNMNVAGNVVLTATNAYFKGYYQTHDGTAGGTQSPQFKDGLYITGIIVTEADTGGGWFARHSGGWSNLSGWTGSTAISSVGTITAGVWQSSTVIGFNYGGTGLAGGGSANQILGRAAAGGLEYKTLSGTNGVLITHSVGTITISTGMVPIAHGGTGLTFIGSAGQVLTSDGTYAYWADPGGVSYPIPTYQGGTGLSDVGTTGQVLTSDGNNLYWATPSSGGGGYVYGDSPVFNVTTTNRLILSF